ncbi:uncharacterized protein LOC62_01G001089 [Vanrija pseudolonga]|uniref:Uncharacterized protein n=1 Tax=Vanrija pseudolonga TaxID=143232 RepID=A0AAF0Y675_9TREE|nr:hypothetical protein LOC62_01G001089 [Vanrija pseudolonga]
MSARSPSPARRPALLPYARALRGRRCPLYETAPPRTCRSLARCIVEIWVLFLVGPPPLHPPPLSPRSSLIPLTLFSCPVPGYLATHDPDTDPRGLTPTTTTVTVPATNASASAVVATQRESSAIHRVASPLHWHQESSIGRLVPSSTLPLAWTLSPVLCARSLRSAPCPLALSHQSAFACHQPSHPSLV